MRGPADPYHEAMATAAFALEEKAKELPQGSFRHTVLLAARRFKSSWVELGKLLVRVRNEALFTEWGFESYEAYCLKDLRIRRQTAEKLARSFSFLAKHEPDAMDAPEVSETAPAFEVVEVLANAEERGQLSADEYRSIRDSIWNPQKPVAELRKEFSERFPPPPPETPAEVMQLRRLAGLARKLAKELSLHSKVPQEVADSAGNLADTVEALAAQVSQ